MKITVPPIKSQGIKTKLVTWIAECAKQADYDRWVEPFMGTGVVAFNVKPKKALLCDSNPHIIKFYQQVQSGVITAPQVREFLKTEGEKLLASNGEYYYDVRTRFNDSGNPLDFLFLNRSCFNGMIRFNRKGGFNVPFCKKPNRFAQSLVTKITNQVAKVSDIIAAGDYEFRVQNFADTLAKAKSTDLVYSDPPYIGRHVDYFDSWSEEEEQELHTGLQASGAKYVHSTWLSNKYRQNDYIPQIWNECTILSKEHFYHVGAKESNRNAMHEALLCNFPAEHGISVSEMFSRIDENGDVTKVEAIKR